MNDLTRALELVALLDRKKDTHKLDYYKPYTFQKRWHNALGYRTDKAASEKYLMCANQIGKTTAAGMEMAMHLTGRYPDWYQGVRFLFPVNAVAAGVTNEATRNIIQKELFGPPQDDSKLGTGSIPIECIGKRTRKAGVPDAFDTVQIKHASGRWSSISLKCYEQGAKKFMGSREEVAWMDEEPPQDILSQVKRGMFSRQQSCLMVTFTPEEGATQVVHQITNALTTGQALVTATWDDAPHMTPEMREAKLATVPEHEREMRTKGVPFAGMGLIFPVMQEKIIVDPIEIPSHWRRLNGIDFGWDHPFAAASIAHDVDADCVYLVHEYHESKATPPIHAAAIKPWGEWIPIVWPPDGLQTEKGSGTTLHLQYRSQGLAMLPHHFTNPPNYSEGQEEGQGGLGVEPGLIEMLTRMQTGRFKVFRTCPKFLEEMRMYHRDEHGRVVKLMDDVISATRYATMSLRHARIKPFKRVQPVRAGASNW